MARMIPSLSTALALAAAVATLSTAADAEARSPTTIHAHHAPQRGQALSVDLVTPDGRALDTHWYEGAVYVEGSQGQRYNIRLTNHTAQRVEAVVTVDGRDVITGKLGDYKRQRGYVLDPYGSVTIEGFRRSLDHVAAFRFSDVGDSYSARRGTPQHVGVIGVAVFKEQSRQTRRQPRPVYPDPYPTTRSSRHYYEPYADEADDGGGYRSRRKSNGRASSAPAPSAGAADMDAPAAEAESRSYRGAGEGRGGYYGGDGSYQGDREYAPRPNELGTSYGETRYSSVREVEFRRRNKRRPDSMLTVYYDSAHGLRARGIPVDPPYYPYYDDVDPDPWPYAREFAPPPPRRY